MSDVTLVELADLVEQVANEVVDWASGNENRGPFSEEIYRSNVQIFGAFTMLAKQLRDRASLIREGSDVTE